jgi:hypothetical protein
MNRTSTLFTRGIVALAFFAIENAASAQTSSSQTAIFPSLPPWLSPLQPQGAGWHEAPPHTPAASPLWKDASARTPVFQLGSRDEDRAALLRANQPGGVCRARGPARSLDTQQNGFSF